MSAKPQAAPPALKDLSTHFAFGQNWASYSAIIDDARIAQAERGLVRLLGEDDLLASCYRRSIELCEKHGLVSLAFPAISTGIYRFPTERAAGIAVQTVVDTLAAASTVAQVIFCCFSDASAQLHRAALDTFGSPCAD